MEKRDILQVSLLHFYRLLVLSAANNLLFLEATLLPLAQQGGFELAPGQDKTIE